MRRGTKTEERTAIRKVKNEINKRWKALKMNKCICTTSKADKAEFKKGTRSGVIEDECVLENGNDSVKGGTTKATLHRSTPQFYWHL
jgi:hypothetical protein